MWKDFKEFAMKGNVMDLAVAVHRSDSMNDKWAN